MKTLNVSIKIFLLYVKQNTLTVEHFESLRGNTYLNVLDLDRKEFLTFREYTLRGKVAITIMITSTASSKQSRKRK